MNVKLDGGMRLLVLFTLTTSLITIAQGIITTGVVYNLLAINLGI